MSKANQLYTELIKAIQNIRAEIPCKYDPASWEDDNNGRDHIQNRNQIAYAKLLCNECPIMALCGEYAITAKEPTGVWGGMSTADREKLLTST